LHTVEALAGGMATGLLLVIFKNVSALFVQSHLRMLLGASVTPISG
jgi:hypothetical protein